MNQVLYQHHKLNIFVMVLSLFAGGLGSLFYIPTAKTFWEVLEGFLIFAVGVVCFAGLLGCLF